MDGIGSRTQAWLVTAVLAVALSQARAAQARPGDQLWVNGSSGVADRGVAIVRDGTSIYALVANDGVKRAEVRQLTAGGTLVRSFTMGGFTQINMQALAVSNGTVYVAGQAANAPILFAFSVSSGAQLWSRTFGGNGVFQKVVVSDVGVVAAGTLAQRLFVASFSTAGADSWTYQAPNDSGASALAASPGVVMIGGFPDFVVRVVSSSTGALVFEDVETPSMGLGQVFALAITGKRAFAAGQGPAGTPFTRAFDMVRHTRLWSAATATWFGTARGLAVSGTTVMTEGSVTPSTSDIYVEALDVVTGSRKWLDVFNPGGFDVGLGLAAAGQRAYAVGLATRANGDQDFVVRALGVADGYVHWTVVSPATGNSSAQGVAVDGGNVYVVGQEPAVPSGTVAFVRAFDTATVGGRVVDVKCPRHGTNSAYASSVATLPHQAFAACGERVTGGFGPATIVAYDIPTGVELWHDDLTAGLAAGTSVFGVQVAATAGQVVAIASVKAPGTVAQIRIRAYDASGTAGSPSVRWTEPFDGADTGFKVRVGARDGIAVAAAVVGGAFTVWEYGLSSCRSGCRLWIDHPLVTPLNPEAIDIRANRAVVANSGTSLNVIVYDKLTSGVANRLAYSSAMDGTLHDAALSTVGAYVSGTGNRTGHTYGAARYVLGTTNGVLWFDDAPLGTQVTEDAWGVAVSGDTAAFACGQTTPPRRHIVRGYDPAGTKLWEAQPTAWSGAGACARMTATTSRVFVAGSDSSDGTTGSFLVAAFNATSGRDDWVDRSLGSTACIGTGAGSGCTASAVAAEGDYLVAGGQSGADGHVRIYEATCSRHGNVLPCR